MGGCAPAPAPSPGVTPPSTSPTAVPTSTTPTPDTPTPDTAVPTVDATVWYSLLWEPIKLDTTPAGDVLTYFADRGLRGEVALVSPGGSTTVVYDVPTIDNPFAERGPVYDWPPYAFVGAGRVDGQWAVLGLVVLQNLHAGADMTLELVAVNLTTGASQIVRPQMPSEKLTTLSLSAWVVLDGVVYWSETSGAGDRDMFYYYTGPSTIYRFDLNTKQQTTVAANVQLRRGPGPWVVDPTVVDGQVCWVTTDDVRHCYGEPTASRS